MNSNNKGYSIAEWNKKLKMFGGEVESSEYGIPVGVDVDQEKYQKFLKHLEEAKSAVANMFGKGKLWNTKEKK